MDNFSTERGYAIYLYRNTGHLKLNFDFHCELQDLDLKYLKREIEKMKQIISEIEDKVEKL